MKTHTPYWSATSLKWKESSRTPRKPVIFGIFAALIFTTSAIGLKAQAFPSAPTVLKPSAAQMPLSAPTTRAARTSVMETISMLLDLARKTSHKTLT